MSQVLMNNILLITTKNLEIVIHILHLTFKIKRNLNLDIKKIVHSMFFLII